MLLQVFTINGVLTLPPIIILPGRMYKDITHKRKPNNRLTSIRGLLHFFVAEEAKKLQISNSLVINEATRTLMRNASPQEIRPYRNFTTGVNSLIKSRSPG